MFFNELFLGAILCFFSVFIYIFSLYYLKDKRYRELFFSLLLVAMTGLLLGYANSLVSLVFLDIPIILGYLKDHERDSLLLSILLTIVLIMTTMINPFIFIIKYGLFLFSYLYFKKKTKNFLDILIGEKTFFLTFIAFSDYSDNLPIMFLSLFSIAVFLYFVILWIVKLLNLKNGDYSLQKLEMQKKVFKITHEIKNPIAVCKGYLDMLDVKDSKKVEKYIPIIRSEMNRALTIMDDFLSLSNISIRKEILDIYLLIEDVRDTMQQLLESQKVKLDIPEYNDELYVIGDYDRLKQVLVNIVKNAYEANSSHIEITTVYHHNQLKIMIDDDGEGIDKESLKRIGEVFYTTKIKGSGIGVNLSREIISLHGGEIKYQSELGKGTSVVITLPIENEILV